MLESATLPVEQRTRAELFVYIGLRFIRTHHLVQRL